jgi:urea transport system ATP-binding protein
MNARTLARLPLVSSLSRSGRDVPVSSGTALAASHLRVGYGRSVIIESLDLAIADGEVACIMGRNGAGKTTLLKALMGTLPLRTGNLALFGHDCTFAPPYRRARAGLAHVPQGRGIFPYLSVRENLQVGLAAAGGRDTGQTDEVYSMFPVLKNMAHRTAGVLSGGQQQQLAIGRALMGRPRLLLLDEPTEGIQPNIVAEIEAVIASLKGRMTILLVEQFLRFALANADHCFVMERGRITLSGPPAELDLDRLHAALAV